MTDLEVDSDRPVKQLPSEYFRAAVRFRALEAEATTPRVKQHLRALIDEVRKIGGEKSRKRAPMCGKSLFEHLVRRHRN
jgi:hypothetical protein